MYTLGTRIFYHTVTQVAIFIFTNVIVAGIATSYSLGSQMFNRNFLKHAVRRVFAEGSKLTAKSIGTKATISVGYQVIVDNKVNLVTVLGDSLFVPWVGEFLGNAFYVGIEYDRGSVSIGANTIFKESLTGAAFASFVLRSSVKAILNQNIGASSIISKYKGGLKSEFGYNVVLHTAVNELGKMIEN